MSIIVKCELYSLFILFSIGYTNIGIIMIKALRLFANIFEMCFAVGMPVARNPLHRPGGVAFPASGSSVVLASTKAWLIYLVPTLAITDGRR